MDPLRSGDPEAIGEYKLIARLGAGGMGVVFLGTRGADRVAIKVMRSSFLDDPSLRTRFEREIDTLKRVRSPYVAQYSDSALEQDFAWHAVEFVNGPTLREWIDARGPLPEEQWWELAEQLKLALDSIHAMGIVHRDVKPSNIIMSDQGAKLIDFGISQDSEATSVTTTGMVAGSPAWLSPEQLEGVAVSAGSDLYSVGSVLVFAATGRSPWGNETSMSIPVIYQKILTGEVNFDGLSSEQRELVEALQRKNPLERSFGGDSLGNPGLTQRPGVNDGSSQAVKTIPVETKSASPSPESRPQASLTGQLDERWEKRLDVVTQQLPLEVVSTTNKQAGTKSLAQFFLVVMGGIVFFAVVAGLFLLGNSSSEPGAAEDATAPEGSNSAQSLEPGYERAGTATLGLVDGVAPKIVGLMPSSDPSQFIMVTELEQTALTFMSTETMSPVDEIVIGESGASPVEISPDGNVVSYNGQGIVDELDTDGASCVLFDLQRREAIGFLPNGAASFSCRASFGPDGDRFFFVQRDDDVFVASQEVRVVQLFDGFGMEDTPVPVGNNPGGIIASDDRLVVANFEEGDGDDVISLYRLGRAGLIGGQLVKEVNVPEGPHSFVLSRDGQRVYFLTNRDQLLPSYIVGVSLETGDVVLRHLMPEHGADLAISPDGKQLAIAHLASDTVSVFDIESEEITQVLEAESVFSVLFSPDGLKVIVGGDNFLSVFEKRLSEGTQ